jgi:hypothetical protein
MHIETATASPAALTVGLSHKAEPTLWFDRT